MTYHYSEWPNHTSPYEALQVETATWGERLGAAEQRLQTLDGKLPPDIESVAISIVDGNSESPENFSMITIYDEQGLDPEKTAALLYVNYEGEQPQNTRDLLDVIHEQRERADVPTAVSVVGYDPGERRIDELRESAWDIAALHALHHDIRHHVVGISNDADMIDASPDYVDHMTHNEHVGSPSVWGSEVAFDAPGGPDLPLNKAVTYLMQNRAMLKEFVGKNIMYGASIATTLDVYAATGWTSKHGDTLPHGIGEPQRLILNVWERTTGREGSLDDDLEPLYKQFTHRVGGEAVVSSRRELLSLYKDLGDPNQIAADLDTKPDNPYRRLTHDQLAEIAGGISLDDPRLKQHLDALDKLFRDIVPPELQQDARVRQRIARESLGLPTE